MKLSDLKHLLKAEVFKHKSSNSSINYPINLFRLVNQGISMFDVEPDDLSNLNPVYTCQKNRSWLNSIKKKEYG